MCQRWKPFYDAARCDVELVLKANNIEVNNQQASNALLMKDVQKEFEDFWKTYQHDPIAGNKERASYPSKVYTLQLLFVFVHLYEMLFSVFSL